MDGSFKVDVGPFSTAFSPTEKDVQVDQDKMYEICMAEKRQQLMSRFLLAALVILDKSANK